MKWKCEKHGFVDAGHRLMWQGDYNSKRWCEYCLNEFLDKFCGPLIPVPDDKEA